MICSAIGREFLGDLRQHVQVAPEGIQVLGLAEAVVFDQPRVIRRVVGHHERRRRIEALDQQAQLVVQRRVGRPAQLVDALLGEPAAHGVEQAVGRLLIVDAVEETEEPAAFVVVDVVALVQNGGDPAADLPAAIGQERLDRVPRVEWVRLVADQLFLAAAQGRDPVRIAPVQLPRELEKLPLLPGGGDTLNDEVRHEGRFYRGGMEGVKGRIHGMRSLPPPCLSQPDGPTITVGWERRETTGGGNV